MPPGNIRDDRDVDIDLVGVAVDRVGRDDNDLINVRAGEEPSRNAVVDDLLVVVADVVLQVEEVHVLERDRVGEVLLVAVGLRVGDVIDIRLIGVDGRTRDQRVLAVKHDALYAELVFESEGVVKVVPRAYRDGLDRVVERQVPLSVDLLRLVPQHLIAQVAALVLCVGDDVDIVRALDKVAVAAVIILIFVRLFQVLFLVARDHDLLEAVAVEVCVNGVDVVHAPVLVVGLIPERQVFVQEHALEFVVLVLEYLGDGIEIQVVVPVFGRHRDRDHKVVVGLVLLRARALSNLAQTGGGGGKRHGGQVPGVPRVVHPSVVGGEILKIYPAEIGMVPRAVVVREAVDRDVRFRAVSLSRAVERQILLAVAVVVADRERQVAPARVVGDVTVDVVVVMHPAV